MAKELFLEIGTEEIPAGFIEPTLLEMLIMMTSSLDAARIKFGNKKTCGTPRRLVLIIDGLDEKQQSVTEEIWGPAKKAAFDQDGKPTKALTGFCKGKGVNADDVEFREKEAGKGEYIYIEKEMECKETVELLPSILTKFVKEISFQKSMRWRALDISFARPVHWIVALYGGEIIDFSFGDLKSSNKSRGHRFHAPAEFEVRSFKDYSEKCISAHVIVSPGERKRLISEGIHKAAIDAGGQLIEDTGLVEEVANLVEYPVVVCGSFDKEYLALPREIVINAMREHQRYFAIEDSKGKLLPNFITVSNTKAKDMNVVKEGNERVLHARLSDAAFYYYEDLKRPLDEMVESLKNVVFQAKLGTSYEKVERFSALTGPLADDIAPELKDKALRAARLAKADLVSGVVGEFAKLQGVMGRDYALKAGEDAEVAEAIFEHYLPRHAEDILPGTDTGAIVSIADKMDTICSCFSVGLIPTGASDPYALRRQTLGIINIIIEKGYRLSLSRLIDNALEILGEKLLNKEEDVKAEILDFFKVRLAGFLTSGCNPHDVVDAVLSRGFDDLVDSVEIVKALSHLKGLPDFEPLAVAFKRVVNITKGFDQKSVDPSLFEGEAEKKLHSEYHSIAGNVNDLADNGKYKEALLKASEIRPFVDTFFDDILVMVDDEKIRDNRLSLLKEVSDLFMRFADFSKIVTENK